MKKAISTMLFAGFVVLTTASFSYAEYVATGANNFPYFHLGCLVVGGLIIVSLKHKYDKMYLSEAIGSFAFYTVLLAFFTPPVINIVRTVVG